MIFPQVVLLRIIGISSNSNNFFRLHNLGMAEIHGFPRIIVVIPTAGIKLMLRLGCRRNASDLNFFCRSESLWPLTAAFQSGRTKLNALPCPAGSVMTQILVCCHPHDVNLRYLYTKS